MSSQWYAKRWVTVSLHVLFWTIFFLFPMLIRPLLESSHADRKPQEAFDLKPVYILISVNNVVRLILFYCNAYLLIPRLIYRRKFWAYFLSLLGFLLVMWLVDYLLFEALFSKADYHPGNFLVFNFPTFLFIAIASTALRMITDRVRDNELRKERETETLKTELSFLRSQVSPHFMFNVLNNMVALARKKSDLLEPSLIKLSSLLRYMLYETDEDKVLLEREVAYLNSYIDLQLQRFGTQVKVTASLQDVQTNYTIAPMLLIPFVENAFKHGTGIINDARIDISLTAEDGQLRFKTSNRFEKTGNEEKDKSSGIGLNNVRRRLNLIYPASHRLEIREQDGWFHIELELDLT